MSAGLVRASAAGSDCEEDAILATLDNDDRQRIIAEILTERVAQDAKWGVQDHPSGDPILFGREGGCTPQRMCEEYCLPSERVAKAICDRAAARVSLTWPAIAVEELSEAVSAAADGTEGKVREELVQLAAVVLAWIECIDRRKLEKFERHIERALERGEPGR